MLLVIILLHTTPPAAPKVPLIDLAFETERQVVVDRELGQYLGHPTTCLSTPPHERHHWPSSHTHPRASSSQADPDTPAHHTPGS